MAGEFSSFYQLTSHLFNKYLLNIYPVPNTVLNSEYVNTIVSCFSVEPLYVIQNYVWRESLSHGETEPCLKQEIRVYLDFKKIIVSRGLP